MNTTLKHWKEAATLVLAAGHGLRAEVLPSRTRVVGSLGKSQLPHRSHFDYDVLLLKRSSKSGFMPNAYVFPGGLVDASDFSSEWVDIFKSFTEFSNYGLRGVKQSTESRPPIFATDRLQFGSPVPAEVAFRICALRETFEECGVLLSVSRAESGHLLKRIQDRYASDESAHVEANQLFTTKLQKWRALVNQNPSNFVKMCRELEVLPNIWALHEWGNWLTPAGRYGVRRFDTAFFMCCLQGVPHTLHDEKEIVQCQWFKPSEILRSYQARELWIAPPQFYELSRMCRFPLLSDLETFASQRASEGCEQLLPVILSKDTHFISVLPGDRLYPPNAAGVMTIERIADSQLEDPEDNPALHRILTMDPYTTQLQMTITPKYNHLLPVIEPPILKSEL